MIHGYPEYLKILTKYTYPKTCSYSYQIVLLHHTTNCCYSFSPHSSKGCLGHFTSKVHEKWKNHRRHEFALTVSLVPRLIAKSPGVLMVNPVKFCIHFSIYLPNLTFKVKKDKCTITQSSIGQTLMKFNQFHNIKGHKRIISFTCQAVRIISRPLNNQTFLVELEPKWTDHQHQP